MAKRGGIESSATSSVGLRPVNLNRNQVHSQTWTLVNEFYMGGRQQKVLDPHEGWKYDVQCQIDSMADKVRESQEAFSDTRASTFCSKPQNSIQDAKIEFERQRLEFSKRKDATKPLSNGPARNQARNQRNNDEQQRRLLPNAITNATEAHLGLMDTTLRGAVLGPNTGQSFNTGLKK